MTDLPADIRERYRHLALKRKRLLPPAIRGWENGTTSPFAVPYHQITQVAAALNQPGTHDDVMAELLIASQCDLLISRMLDGTENYAEPLPID